MLPSKLLQILAKNKESARPYPEVLTELRNQGWREDTLADAEIWYQNYQPPMTPQMRAVKRKKELLESSSLEKKHIPAKFFSKNDYDYEMPESEKAEVAVEKNEIKKAEPPKQKEVLKNDPPKTGGVQNFGSLNLGKEEKSDSPNPELERKIITQRTSPKIAKEEINGEVVERMYPFFAILTAAMAILLAVGFTAVVSIAYGKINIGNRDIQHKIRNIVQGLPFAPKTADYIIDRAVEADSNIKSSYIEASMASESKDLAGMLGVGNFDLSVNGPFDLSDQLNPKLSLNLKMGDDFESDLMFINNMFYFRFSRVPEGLQEYLKMMGIPILEVDNYLNRWYSYKIPPKQNEARDFINESHDTTYFSNELRKLLRSDLLSKFTVSKSEIDGRNSYELTLDLSDRDLQNLLLRLEGSSIPSAVSDADSYISGAVIKVWVDTETYYTQKSVVMVTINNVMLNSTSSVLGDADQFIDENLPPDPEGLPGLSPNPAMLSAPNEANIVFSLKLSQFNQQFVFEEPSNAVSYEDLMAGLTGGLPLDTERFIPEILKPFVWQINENDSRGIVPLPK